MSIDKIIARLKSKLDDFETGIGASIEEIEAIEREFDIEIPTDYKYFLQTYGYATWDGTDILGICHDDELEEYFSMPYFTRADRAKSFPEHFASRPKDTIVIGPYGGGGRFFLHCSPENSGKVMLLLTELGGRPDTKTWDSFSDFIAHY